MLASDAQQLGQGIVLVALETRFITAIMASIKLPLFYSDDRFRYLGPASLRFIRAFLLLKDAMFGYVYHFFQPNFAAEPLNVLQAFGAAVVQRQDQGAVCLYYSELSSLEISRLIFFK